MGSGFPKVVVAKEIANIFCSDSLDGGYEYISAVDVGTAGELWKTKSRKIDWTVDLPREFGSELPRWGLTSLLMLIDDVVILETGGTEERAFTVFDQKSGKGAWNHGIGSTSYNSPTIAEIDGQTNIVFANDAMLTSFNPKGEAL